MKRLVLCTAPAAACLLAGSVVADIGGSISSPDGRWVANFDGAGTGQLGDLLLDGTGQIFETIWYEATDGGLSARIATLYSPVSENIGANMAEFRLLRNDSALQLDVVAEMISGDTGGILYTLTWTNVDSSGRAHTVKPFAYADFDVGGDFGDDQVAWNGAWIEQRDDTGVTMNFGVLQTYKSYEAQIFADLRTALDNGRNQLTGDVGNGSVADWTAALSGNPATLELGDSMTFRFALGGVIPAPGAIALLGVAGLVTRRRRRN